MKRFLAALGLTLLLSGNAFAASGEHIVSFHDDIAVNADGTNTVVETIVYDFGTNQHHGIERTIPVRYADEKGQHYYLTLRFEGVTDDQGKQIQYTESDNDGSQVYRIGDPDHTITGQHTYRLIYSQSSIVRPADTYDRIAINVTGTGWGYPIDSASATITYPGIAPTATACFTGPANSKASNCTATTTGEFTTTKSLAAGEGLTVQLDYPKSTFSGYLAQGDPPGSSHAPSASFIVLAIVYGLLVLGGLSWPLVVKLQLWRRKRAQTVVAEYEAPDGLKPGQLGLLSDNKVGMPEITATLLDLAVRGYMKITQLRKKSLLQSANYQFAKLKPGDDLTGYEQTLFFAIFSAGDSVELKDLDRTSMSVAVTAVKKAITDGLKTSGYYKQTKYNWPYVIILAVLTLPLLFVGIPFFIFAIFIAIALGAAVQLTDLGLEEWRKVAGFKLFLSVTETDRLAFSDAPDKTPELFNKLLPAAVALGVEKQWAQQFESMDISSSSNGWYSGVPGENFNAVFLASSLGSDFGSAVSSGFAPVSSGGGGGGFSGGGVGGGGGGSW